MGEILRSCVVCRQKGSKGELLRFVADEEEVFALSADLEQRKHGRGAYCHLLGKCLSEPLLPKLLLAAIKREKRKFKKSEGSSEFLKEVQDLSLPKGKLDARLAARVRAFQRAFTEDKKTSNLKKSRIRL